MLRSTSSLSLLRFLLLLGVCLCLCLCLSLCLGVAPPFAAAAAAAAEPAPPIAGGFEVPRGRWPDAVAVLLRDGVCTGTLIAPDLVLTAGHCIDGIPVEVALDTTDYGAPGGERIRVAWARAYPDWPYRYDVGVVVLQHPARQRPRRLAAPCTARDKLVRGQRVTLVGFGLAAYGDDDARTHLRQAAVAITDPTCTLDASCQPSIAPAGEFLAGGHGADACSGDPGGPVYVEVDGGGPALLGVVSRGLAFPTVPCGGGGVYVRADQVAAWIQRVTDRRLERTACDGGAGEAPGSPQGGGGCTTGGAAGLAAALALLSLLARRSPLAPSPRCYNSPPCQRRSR